MLSCIVIAARQSLPSAPLSVQPSLESHSLLPLRKPRGFSSTTHYSPPTTHSSCPFVFITLRIAFPATPLYSHPYKSLGGVPSATSVPARKQAGSNLRALCVALFPRICPSCVFSNLQTLFLSLSSFLRPLVFVFSHLRTLLQKYRGGGSLFSSLESRRSTLLPFPALWALCLGGQSSLLQICLRISQPPGSWKQARGYQCG
jgi:hypothetical protein